MTASIRDVAKKAGVAPSTVSKALNGTGSISKETVLLIKRAANELGYLPARHAHAQKGSKFSQIIFLAEFPYDAAYVNPHLFEIIRGLEHTLSKNGYCLTVKHANQKQTLEFLSQHASLSMFDGVVLNASVVTPKIAALIERLNLPHIIVGQPSFDSRLCWIDNNNALSGGLAARHLLSLGYTSIAFVGGRADDMISWQRLRGARAVLAENKELLEGRVIQSNSTIADGARAAHKLLKLCPRPRAVICANSLIAFGCLHGFQEKKLRVPEDVAIISFDTYPMSLFTEPQLTVVDINMYSMGQETGRLLIQKLNYPQTLIQCFTTTPELVVRGSC